MHMNTQSLVLHIDTDIVIKEGKPQKIIKSGCLPRVVLNDVNGKLSGRKNIIKISAPATGANAALRGL